MSLINWVKKNKLTTILLMIVGFLVIRPISSIFFETNIQRLSIPSAERSVSKVSNPAFGSLGAPSGISSGIALPDIYPQEEYTPQTDTANRLIIQESNTSLLVKDVIDARNKILQYTNANGGYMVTSSTSSPEETPYATITVRVPSDKLQATLDYFNSLAVKVVSENLVGRDVTDQYIDIDRRITTYERTRTKYEEILDRATSITDITNLTREIINTQSQIDNLKGQQESLKQNANLAKLTIYLSTDEIALPYAPSETFRPGVIFKLAVRSLVGFLRNLAEFAIWLGVYAVIWLPALVIYLLIRRWWKKRKDAPKPTPSL